MSCCPGGGVGISHKRFSYDPHADGDTQAHTEGAVCQCQAGSTLVKSAYVDRGGGRGEALIHQDAVCLASSVTGYRNTCTAGQQLQP